MDGLDIPSKSVGISLGWNCASAIWGVANNERECKMDGYKTCPFDEMMSNYPGMIECIRNDFHFFTDPEHLEIKSIPDGLSYINYDDYCNEIIVNTKYNFAFNHESSGHPFLPAQQNWGGCADKYHYSKNGFAFFIDRYNRRISNFKSYMSDPNNQITFILSRYDTNQNNIQELRDVLSEKYPRLNYKVIILETNKTQAHNDLLMMGMSENDEEVMRLR